MKSLSEKLNVVFQIFAGQPFSMKTGLAHSVQNGHAGTQGVESITAADTVLTRL